MTQITATQLREILEYDPKTGIFTWAKRISSKTRVGAVAGSLSGEGYARLKIFNREYYQHRLAWLYVYGRWPKLEIDHINGCRTDNRICNLRDVPRSLNMQNRMSANKTNKSTGLLGVTYRESSKTYHPKIGVGGQRIALGTFRTAESASAAYREAKRKLHPGATS